MGSITAAADAVIETIDLSAYLSSDDPIVRKATADRLVQALHKQGGCGLVGHGLTLKAIHEALTRSKEFFDLPLDQKQTINHPEGILPHRGYSGVSREKIRVYTEDELQSMSGELGATAKKAMDWKEHYDIGSDYEPEHHNRWIDKALLPGFQPFMSDFITQLEQLHTNVLNAILLGLEVDPISADYFRGLHTHHNSGIRLLHYPSMRESEIDRTSTTWCPIHTDFTTFTFLIQDENQGLEIEDRTNKTPNTFVAANPSIPDRLWLTIGDFGEIWTNGYLPASRHRVVIPAPLPGSGTDMTSNRYSIPYFLNPRHDGILEPLGTGKPATMPRDRYKKMKVRDHIEFRMKYQYTDPTK
ncbi:hypothetical protein BJY01DRAFT_254120 [Aspergillus pseudoustus]|uniref:Fe2OG dioxygenase domain-containing protein n=1 Tax=Aspergillus pseudoustus TaxID=1810923 RepID=A0ABR4IYG7_9EURO